MIHMYNPWREEVTGEDGNQCKQMNIYEGHYGGLMPAADQEHYQL